MSFKVTVTLRDPRAERAAVPLQCQDEPLAGTQASELAIPLQCQDVEVIEVDPVGETADQLSPLQCQDVVTSPGASEAGHQLSPLTDR